MTFPAITEIEIKGRIIGGSKPNICVPLVALDLDGLLAEAANVPDIKPDIVEWRVDYFNEVEDFRGVREALVRLREVIPGYPLIFTCRDQKEGGCRDISREVRGGLIKEIIGTGQVDMVDIELDTGRDNILEIVAEAQKNNVCVIVSNHDFKKTPPKEEIVARLVRAQDCGADITKIAVMPVTPQDVLDLLSATLEFRQNHARVPVVSMSMSAQGLVSRVAGFLYGSAITFAAGKDASAPGQISIERLRTAVDILSIKG